MAPKAKGKKASSAASDSSSAAHSASPGKSARPNWPLIQNLLPEQDLALHELLPGQIVTISNFWPSKLCKEYVNFLSNLPLATTPGTPKKGEAVRVNDRFQIDDPLFAEQLWSGTSLKNLVLGLNEEGSLNLSEGERRNLWGGEVVGLNPNIRIYRYKKGQFFDQHYDDSNLVTLPGTPPIQAKTTWTLLLYLTSPATGCVGGETVFYPEPAVHKKGKSTPAPEPLAVGLEVGMALLHRHGKECMLHEGREVLDGEKWVIRSDLCVRR